ncbi:hypothetical protein QM012_006435 [Aureobasidium pullulans]|uniref:DNA 3'-5' helicase n=1 Tax=Aureobasidium pullulans TaxID=5580 RepID=A0ABR0TQ10_AURPU
MYTDKSYNHSRPYEQTGDDNTYDYIRPTSYENDRTGYEPSRTRRTSAATRQSQAEAGRARLSLPPYAQVSFDPDECQIWDHACLIPDQYSKAYMTSLPEEAQYTIQPADSFIPTGQHQAPQQPGSSSSSMNVLPSSPAYRASLRLQNSGTMISHRTYNKAQQERPDATARGASIVQGIQLVPVHALPDRFQTIFPFAMFNAVQSACFESIYESNDNCVFSSPTGSGKTVLFEIAICRMLRGWQNGTFKVVYMAPTKSLCSERSRDWKAKFEPLNLRCEELTGDSDISSLHHVQRADIIVTTPEKWDSMTRKWKDHEKLVSLIKLLLIDEVHILNKDRGAALEVVVSRMKSIGSGTRFVALSATVPNSQDIATWLGRNDGTPDIPALHKRFGEEFRPVELTRHVCGYQPTANTFGFDAILTKKLPDVITKYSQRKPVMVFCSTRKSCAEAAKLLAEWWKTSAPRDRRWPAPRDLITVQDKGLQSTIAAGVAVHHAGLTQQDRTAVETAYLAGSLSVICCTSTLAVGVNLPCHMVIVKNTVIYEAGAIKEYSDLEIMQMIGRAGRPQFDASALAVIMTRMQQVKHYEQLLSGQERLESCLHLNLVEHLNAEIGLGMIPDLSAAKKWLAGTFLKVRLKDNPMHYHINGDTPDRNLGARLERICESALSKLKRLELIEQGSSLQCTEYGDAMARYYVDITTMESILGLPRKPKISEILTIISQAHEFREIRFRAGEKLPYKELNSKNDIRFPFKIDLSTAAHKVSLIIQAVLGQVDHIAEQTSHRVQYNCQNIDKDAVGIRNSLMLSRSLAARVWDDSPMVLQQIEQVGPVAVRKLVDAGITNVDELLNTNPGRLELVLNKAPPFGMKMHRQVQTFPRLRISLEMSKQPITKTHEHVAVKLKIDFGFLNNKTPVHYRNKPVFVIILLGTSDGHRIEFFRLSAAKLQNVSPITKTAYLTNPFQLVECYVMIDDLAGTMQEAVLKPQVPLSAFNSIKDTTADTGREKGANGSVNAVKRTLARYKRSTDADEWDDGGLNDDDFINVEPQEDEFPDVDALDHAELNLAKRGKTKNKTAIIEMVEASDGQRLENGNYACNHRCKDRTACKHKCCKEGLEKKPKPKKPKDSDACSTANKSKISSSSSSSARMQTKLELPIRRKVVNEPVEHLDLSQASASPKPKVPTATARLASLYSNTTRPSKISKLGVTSIMAVSKALNGSSERPKVYQSPELSRSIGERIYDNLPSWESDSEIWGDDNNNKMLSEEEDYLDQDEEMLDAALVGLQDSHSLQTLDELVEPTRNAQMFDMLDSGADPQKDNSEPTFFVTPHPQRVDDLLREFDDDAAAMFDQNMDDDDSTWSSMVKRKRNEGITSTYFSTKKAKTDDEGNMQSYEMQAREEERDKESVEDKERREKEELRVWLAAELGDSVEMI